MNRLRLAIAAFAAFATAMLATPAGSQSGSPVAVSSVSTNAGSPEVFTIIRTGGNSRLVVLVQSGDATAKAGTDYTAVRQYVTLPRGQKSFTISVPTQVNTSALKLSFTLTAAASNVAATGVGTIIEPSQTCPDGSVQPLAATCPAPPPPPPPSTWVSAPLTNGGYARCAALGGCHSFGTGYPPIIAQQGDVLIYAWDGAADPQGTGIGRVIGAFWPIGHYPRATGIAADWTLGVEGYPDEWEGVAPASSPGPLALGALVQRQGLVYRVADNGTPDPFVTGGGTIYGVQYVSDTTGHYYLAAEPTLKQEIQYFMASDLTPVAS